MKNVIDIEGHKAVVAFDPDIRLFRGEFLGLAGGADFYADTVDALYDEGRNSLRVFLDMCREKGIEPRRSYSGRFNVRLAPETHAAAAIAAAANDLSLNDWVAEAIETAAKQA
ncbi:MAG: type II toxin-antitoxin system HicB family antitoxin [Pseudomonadota bacterium]